MSGDVLQKLMQFEIDNNLAPKDQRVYLVGILVNSILAGNKLSDIQKERLKEFPNLIKLLEFFQNLPELQRPNRIHVSLGPDATVESLSEELLRWHTEEGTVVRTLERNFYEMP